MVKKANKEHFQNINLSAISVNKNFQTTANPLFGNKVKTNHELNFIEKKIVTLDQEIGRLNNIFGEIVPKLNIILSEFHIRKTEALRIQ